VTKFSFIEEQLFLTTVLLEVADGGKRSLGTGFLVRWEIPNRPGYWVVAIVTCKHVLLGGRGTLSFKRHQNRTDDPDLPDLGRVAKFRPGPFQSLYVEHDDPEIDVAAINVSTLFAQRKDLFQKFFQPKDFADFERDTIGPTERVLFVGYPDGLHDETHLLPILRTGTIASIPSVDFNGKPVFLIDAQVYGGSSGSPVLIETPDSYKIVGLVAAVYEVDRNVFLASQQPKVKEGLGIGVVFKVKAIADVLQKMAKLAKDL